MKLIILDRDGVINYDSDEFIKHPDEWRPIPGSLDAIARLRSPGGASWSPRTNRGSAAVSWTWQA